MTLSAVPVPAWRGVWNNEFQLRGSIHHHKITTSLCEILHTHNTRIIIFKMVSSSLTSEHRHTKLILLSFPAATTKTTPWQCTTCSPAEVEAVPRNVSMNTTAAIQQSCCLAQSVKISTTVERSLCHLQRWRS